MNYYIFFCLFWKGSRLLLKDPCEGRITISITELK